jgi:E3 ubiquitin-protein ligase TRIP12
MHINLDVKWKDTIPPMMKTIVDLIPSLPRGGMFSTRRFKEHSSSRRTGDDLALDPRVLLFKEKPEVMLSIDTILIPLVLDIYVSTVNLRVRQLITHGLVKIIHYSDIDTLSKVLESLSFSSFLSGILTRQEHPSLLIDALYQCELLSDKMPAIYHSLFEREGVLHEIELISKLPFEQPNSSDPAAAPTEESDAATNTDGDRREEESEEEERSSQRSPDSEANRGADRTSLARRLIERNELAAILRNRYDISRGSEQEKGIGKGSTRKYIIQLAQNFIEKYNASEAKTVAGSNLKDIQRFTHALKEPSDADPLSQQTLIELSSYLRAMGISSFELINSGLIKALLSYLIDKDGFKSSLDDRHRTFEQVFVHQTDVDKEGNNALKKLVHRLQELLARFEAFEVVMPLESSDTARNPIGMLAKQLRLKLTGRGEGIPNTFQQLMVSTHAVATFRVLEEYLLARIGEPRYDEEEDEEDDEEEEEEEHLLFEHAEEEEEMDEDGDTIMTEAVVIKDNHSEEEDDEEKHEENPSDASKEAESSSQTQKKKEGEWEIRFYVRDALISNDTTIYAAVHQYESQSDQIQRNIWTSAYPITFERVWVTQEDKHKEDGQPVCQLANIEQPKELKEDSVCLEAIHLLKALSEFISVRPDGIEAQDFINRKLTAKMNRQLEEPLTVASSCLPRWSYWLMSNAPFLFPFETRYLFIQSTSFGYSRLISRWQSLQMRNNTQNGPRDDGHHHQQPLLGRMERQKVRIIRSQILESAIKILDLFGSSPAVLEIEYADEEGTGLGPTLEFYASASKEFCKHSINMWYGSVKSETGYLDIAQGLFPKSLARQRTGKSAKKIINLFKTLGRFVAKALLDFRIIDIPFNAAFFKVVFDETKPSPELLKVKKEREKVSFGKILKNRYRRLIQSWLHL